MRPARVLLTWLSIVFVAALAAQFFLAGAGAFGAGWDAHVAFGIILVLGSLLLVVVAGFARRLLLLAIVLFVLMVAQMVLAQAGADASAWVAALHGLNALVVFGLATMIAVRSRRAEAPQP